MNFHIVSLGTQIFIFYKCSLIGKALADRKVQLFYKAILFIPESSREALARREILVDDFRQSSFEC